jgi:hypothetical protein
LNVLFLLHHLLDDDRRGGGNSRSGGPVSEDDARRGLGVDKEGENIRPPVAGEARVSSKTKQKEGKEVYE